MASSGAMVRWVRWVNPFQGSFAYRLVQSGTEAAAAGRTITARSPPAVSYRPAEKRAGLDVVRVLVDHAVHDHRRRSGCSWSDISTVPRVRGGIAVRREARPDEQTPPRVTGSAVATS